MSAKPNIKPNDENRQPTTLDERKAAKKARKDHRARVRLVIETYEWLINCRARAGEVDKCQKLADEMMAKAQECPEDFGRWKSVVVQSIMNPQKDRDHGK